MKIAVTGGSGFIASRLIPILEEKGHECVIVDIRHTAPVDILDLSALTDAFAGCGAVYHLAAEHRDDVYPREKYYEVNVRGAKNVAKAAESNGINRIIYTSSFAVYGLDARTPDEMSAPAPFNDYGQSKLEGEEIFRHWTAANRHANLTVVRPVVVFGEGNRGNVHTLINQVASHKFMMVGDGRNRKSIAYVGNVAAFLFHLLESGMPRNQIYNYSDTPDYTMNDLLAIITRSLGYTKPFRTLPFPVGLGAGYTFDALSRITGRKFPISAVRIRKFCADTTCNAEKARRDGFTPPYTLDEGLARTIACDFADCVEPPLAPLRKAG